MSVPDARQRRTSIRTQLIVGSITILTVVLVMFGFFVRYVVSTTLMASVDRDLTDRTNRMMQPPPRPRGDHGGGIPPDGLFSFFHDFGQQQPSPGQQNNVPGSTPRSQTPLTLPRPQQNAVPRQPAQTPANPEGQPPWNQQPPPGQQGPPPGQWGQPRNGPPPDQDDQNNPQDGPDQQGYPGGPGPDQQGGPDDGQPPPDQQGQPHRRRRHRLPPNEQGNPPPPEMDDPQQIGVVGADYDTSPNSNSSSMVVYADQTVAAAVSDRPNGPDQPQFPDQYSTPGHGDPYGGPPDEPGEGPPHSGDPYQPRVFRSDGKPENNFNSTRPWDPVGIRLAASSNRPIFRTIKYGGVDMRVITRRRTTRDGHVDFVQAPYPLAQVERAINGVDRALLTLIPIALLLSALGGAFLTKNVLGRVRQLVTSASSIGANDLSQRLPVAGSDEFAELADTFNALLGRVEGAFLEQQRIVEQQRRFTADASHELKTPLTVIRGTTSMALAGDGQLDRESTFEIDAAATSMSDLVMDLIYLARSDAGQLGRERIDLLLLEPLQRAIQRVAKVSSVPIILAATDESVVVTADDNQIFRLFCNILQNAAQHTGSGGEIRVSIERNGDFATVTVQDNGTGIAQEHIPHLFERFYRVDSSRSRDQGGSGLGLSICKGIVDAHDGTLDIASTVGSGTIVTITLPAAPAD